MVIFSRKIMPIIFFDKYRCMILLNELCSFYTIFMSDAKFGVLSLLPNLLTGYGWNPGNRIYNWFGEVIEKKMGNKDVTFGEVCVCWLVNFWKFGSILWLETFHFTEMSTLVLILLGAEYIYILIYQELYSDLCETFDSQLWWTQSTHRRVHIWIISFWHKK